MVPLTVDDLYALAPGEKHGKRRTGDDSLCPVAALAFDDEGGVHTVVRIVDPDKKDVVLYDAVRHAPWDRIESLLLSPTGDHIAYAGKKGKQWHAVVDGREGPPFDEVMLFEHGPGGRIAYIGRTKKRWHAVVDGDVGEAFSKVDPPVWSAADGGFRYAANRGGNFDRYGLGGGGTWAFFVDRREVDGAAPAPVDRWRVERVDGGQRVSVDGVAGDVLDVVGYFAQSDDGAHWAYLGDRGGVRYLIVDGDVRDEFEPGIETGPVFSPDGSRLAYYGERDGQPFACIDGERVGGNWDGVDAIRFSPDSQRVAFVARDGTDQRWVVDGQPGPLFDELTYDMHDTPFTWSRDSRHFAYVGARKKKHVIVVDGEPAGDPFVELVTWQRDPAGDRIVGIARTKPGFVRAEVDLR
ncbi:MAG: hypothetical protein D6689_08075 [Deltaproteobacteria bacterium]|nr:MAG: hypothetical protein D6689_08075 [Deltaproteobacteria bacterium]